MYAWGWLVSTSAVGVALIEIPLLMLLTTPLFIRASREEARFDLGGLLAFGSSLRFAATYYRFTNAADGATYHLAGAELAKSYRNLDFGVDTGYPGARHRRDADHRRHRRGVHQLELVRHVPACSRGSGSSAATCSTGRS